MEKKKNSLNPDQTTTHLLLLTSIALDEYLMITEGSFFLFLIENICCSPSSEPSRRYGSDEGSQHVFLC